MKDTLGLIGIELVLQDWHESRGEPCRDDHGRLVIHGEWTTRWSARVTFWQTKARAVASHGTLVREDWRQALQDAKNMFSLPHEHVWSPYSGGNTIIAPRVLVWWLWLKAYLGKAFFNRYDDVRAAALLSKGYTINGKGLEYWNEDGHTLRKECLT